MTTSSNLGGAPDSHHTDYCWIASGIIVRCHPERTSGSDQHSTSRSTRRRRLACQKDRYRLRLNLYTPYGVVFALFPSLYVGDSLM